MITHSVYPPIDPVSATVEVPNNQWTLLVAPHQGWVPSWRSPMLATVIIISVLMGGLMMATLVSRHLQLWLLKETKVCNKHAWPAWLQADSAVCSLLGQPTEHFKQQPCVCDHVQQSQLGRWLRKAYRLAVCKTRCMYSLRHSFCKANQIILCDQCG